MIDVVALAVGIAIGLLAGVLLAKYWMTRPDMAAQGSAFGNMAMQVAEMKARFEEIEKSRTRQETDRQKLDEEKDKRFGDFVTNIRQLLIEMSDKNTKSDEEKEKRIKVLMEQNKDFFEQQKSNTEKFLMEQGKSREEIERKRDAQIADMNKMLATFTKTVSGTKTRGMMGEELLKEALSNSIRAGVVECGLKTDKGEIEFAWNLNDGHYIPIDSKLPDVFDLLESFNSKNDEEDRKDLKKQILEKVKKEVERIQKYQNLSNTVDSCILVIPDGVLDIAPELVGNAKKARVYVCSYKDVFPIAHLLQDRHIQLHEQGEIGQYKALIEALGQIIRRIGDRANAIERAISTIENANDKIKDEVVKAKGTRLEEGEEQEEHAEFHLE